ncbi:MAG TPA: CDP-alcohol phosphatidyltransferase family protein [Rhizobiales bacterium]|nr:putative CDP-diacylglycerol--glycerol-3-phosphate 3-phosphatidyl-transferase 2 [bacterium BMS3Bbin10]HDO51242.1 CDP-alcohol phosphatidyltransferase family protein [Hyphomicrobiales bacterium]
MYIPNAITVFRIFLVPMVIWLMIDGRMRTAFMLFLIAGLSDGLDGYLAKRYGWQTELGAYLDPIADKALLVSIYVVLGLFTHLPVWLVIAVVTRDILIIGAILLSWLLAHPVPMRPLLISKANTVAQIVLAAMVLGNLGFSLGLAPVINAFVWVTGGLTILSAGAYLVRWLRFMTSYEDQPQKMPVKRSTRGEGQTQRRKETVTGS